MDESTVARYAEITDAGFTFVTGGNHVEDLPPNAAMLSAAAANDLPALVIDHRISNIQDYPPEQWPEIVEAALREYQEFPAFAGFTIRDEPHAGLFAQIGRVNDIMRDLDPSVLGYVNLFPEQVPPAGLGAPTYRDYLAQYVDVAHAEFVSFDHYMLLKPSGVTDNYFYNWVLVRDEALHSGVPSWVFILACEHFGYRLPTEAELLWQVNVSLAYGCKGIQYFTYWLPAGSGFLESLVSRTGELMPLYFAAQRINNDYLQPVGKQLLPLTSESVTHYGEAEPPRGVEVFSGDDWVASAAGSPVLLSRFYQQSGDDTRWLLVANRSFDTTATTTLRLHLPVDVVEFDPASEHYVLARTRERPKVKNLTVRLAPGAGRLYRLHRASNPAVVAPTARMHLLPPGTLVPGRATGVEVSLRNSPPTLRPLLDGRVELEVPAGWTAQSLGATTVDLLQPGEALTGAWDLAPPLGAQPGHLLLGGSASYDDPERGRVLLPVSAQAAVVPVIEALELSMPLPVYAGHETLVPITIVNRGRSRAEVTVRLQAGDGWEGDVVTQRIPAESDATVMVPITPTGSPPSAGTITYVTITAQVAAVEEIVTLPGPKGATYPVPHGQDTQLALDCGAPTSPVLDSYSRLSHTDSWDAARGYGWVTTNQDFRDRGFPDPLRRDFILGRGPASVLRIHIPPGEHVVSALRGDNMFASTHTKIEVDGQVLVPPGPGLGVNVYAWEQFSLDGGGQGRDVDLRMSNEDGNYWWLNALVVQPAS